MDSQRSYLNYESVLEITTSDQQNNNVIDSITYRELTKSEVQSQRLSIYLTNATFLKNFINI